MFVDRIRVFAQAGNGGRGCVSFRREKYVPHGGPDGGDGGRGGDVILRADTHTDNLSNLFYEPIIKAGNGAHGQGKQKYGRSAKPKIVKVPIGTVVQHTEAPVPRNDDVEPSTDRVAAVSDRRTSYDADPKSSEQSPARTNIHDEQSLSSEDTDRDRRAPRQLADLTYDGEEFVLCRGGGGGKGNVHFKSSRNRAPVQYTEGEEGEKGHYLLELRMMADGALVGYPNAGKSTLLGRISAAHPKVAPYPFTTLHPVVGVIELDQYRRASIADVPGLIEGAHRNIGLGHDFLRHITRCRILLFVLDIAGSEGRNPIEDLQNLRREIDLYDSRLALRPWYVIANKMDLSGASENLCALQQRFPGVEVVAISAERSDGVTELLARLGRWLEQKTEKSTKKDVSRVAEVAASE